ncbi:hypothetical protein BBJ28_00005109 [Nothophytophthora sp. Chile5]|nr:hypothetical protein BBJ28_00005109 [Nothophytophthora sp. Chile5]
MLFPHWGREDTEKYRYRCGSHSADAKEKMGARDDDAEPALILEHVLLGSRAHARDKELLQRLRITHILNLQVLTYRCRWILVCKVQVTPPKKTDPVAGVPNFFEKDKLFT